MDDTTYEQWLATEEALDRHMDILEARQRDAEERALGQDPQLKRAFFAAMDALDRAMAPAQKEAA